MKNNSFRETTRYVLEKEGAKLLDGTMVNTDTDTLAGEFMMSRDINPNIERPVYHLVQSYAYEDQASHALTDPKLVELAMKHFAGIVISAYEHELLEEKNSSQYRNRVDEFMDNQMFEYQFFIAKHQDTDHVHTHLVASRINLLDGLAIPTYLERVRTQKICRSLEKEYGLRQLENSWEVETRKPSPAQKEKAAATGTASIQEKLQAAIEKAAQTAHPISVDEFINTMNSQGIDVKLHPRGHQIGMSYAMDGVSMRASKLGRKYTYQGLQKYFGVTARTIDNSKSIPTSPSPPPEIDPLREVLQAQDDYASKVAPVVQAIWRRELSQHPNITHLDLGNFQIQREEDATLRLFKGDRLMLDSRGGRYQGYGLSDTDIEEIERLNQISQQQFLDHLARLQHQPHIHQDAEEILEEPTRTVHPDVER